MKIHDLKDLLNLVHLFNGWSTFTCPTTRRAGTYSLENVGTLLLKDATPQEV